MEKLAANEPINNASLLSIFEPIHKADKAKKVSPAPTVSIVFSLKAGHRIEDQFLQLTKIEPNFPFVTIMLSTNILFFSFFAKLRIVECLSLSS